jgi:hypothetical protein
MACPSSGLKYVDYDIGSAIFFLIRIVGGGVQARSTRHVGHWMAHCTCPSATLSTTNPTWPDPGLNPGRRGGKPATNRLSYGAAFGSAT